MSNVHSSSLLVAATGTGKTAMLAGVARCWPHGRVLVMSHRFELNKQAMAEFERICCEPVDLEQADYFADQRSNPHRIVVASVQTLNAKRKGKYRMERFRPEEFGLLVCDEAHRSAAESYRRVVTYFRQNPKLKYIGCTATPDRLDGIGLGCVFDVVACDYNLLWGIENGWLVEPAQKFVKVAGLDLSQVRTKGGDLDEQQLAKLLEIERSLHEMAAPIVDICGEDKQAIVFTASVKQAQDLADKINDYRARKFGERPGAAVAVDGSMSPQDPKRRQIIEDYKNGSIQYLTNCSVFTEGFDSPATKVIAIGRPTKSRALYLQALGRGTRPLPGTVDGYETPAERIAAIKASEKPQCTIIDFVGQSGRHKLVCSTDILAGQQPEDVVERAKQIQRRNGFQRSTLEALREAKAELEAEREAKRQKITVGVDYEIVDAIAVYDPRAIPKVFCPGYLQRVRPTEKQRNFMLKLGYTGAQIDGMNTREASAAINHALEHPKTGFAKWMARKKAEEKAG